MAIHETNNGHLPKPWINEDGELLPDEKLKEISKEWDVETWKRYLFSLERPLAPNIVLKTTTEGTFDPLEKDPDPNPTLPQLLEVLEQMVNSLPPKQNREFFI